MVSEAAIAIDQRYLGTKTAEGLGEFESDITGAQDQEMLRNLIEFQRLDMCERPHLGQSMNRFKRSSRAGVDDDILTAKRSRPAAGHFGFDSLGAHETPHTHHQFRTAFLVKVEMNIDEVLHHLALAFAYRRHVDANIFFADAELLAAIKERGHLGAVDDVFARQARDVRARTAHIFALDHNYALSLLSGGPGNQLSAGTAAEHDEIIFFRIGVDRIHIVR